MSGWSVRFRGGPSWPPPRGTASRAHARQPNKHVTLGFIFAERVGVVGVVEYEALARLDGAEVLAGFRETLVVIEAASHPDVTAVHHFVGPNAHRRRRKEPTASQSAFVEPLWRRGFGMYLVRAKRVHAVATWRNTFEIPTRLPPYLFFPLQ